MRNISFCCVLLKVICRIKTEIYINKKKETQSVAVRDDSGQVNTEKTICSCLVKIIQEKIEI